MKSAEPTTPSSITDTQLRKMSNVKVAPGFELPPDRIVNGDVSLFWIGIVTKQMLQIFDAHGLMHYQVIGQNHVVIEQGDPVLIEGWDEAGLDEIFADGDEEEEADKTFWREHVSIAKWTILDYRAYERLLATLEHGKLTDLASFHLLPTGIQKFFALVMEQAVSDNTAFNERGLHRDDRDTLRAITSLNLPKPRNTNVQRDLTENDLTRIFHKSDISAALFPDGCWLPTPDDLDAAFADMESLGFKKTEGDDAIPTVLEKRLDKIKDDDEKEKQAKRDRDQDSSSADAVSNSDDDDDD